MKSLSKSILSAKILKREAVPIKKGVNLSIQLVAVTSTGRPASVSRSTESVPRRAEGSTGKYQHEVEGVPEGAFQGNSRD